MTRILIAECMQEISSFNPVPSEYDDFEVKRGNTLLFLSQGRDQRNYDLIVVKSPHCEYHMYDEWAEKDFNIDAPGATSANIAALGHRICARPTFPLDPETSFVPAPRTFRRGDPAAGSRQLAR